MTASTLPLNTELWNDSQGLAAARRCGTCVAEGVQRYGEVIWDWMAFRWEKFTLEQIAADLHSEYPSLSIGTCHRYVRGFKMYAMYASHQFDSVMTPNPDKSWSLVERHPRE